MGNDSDSANSNLRERTKQFAIRIIRLHRALPKTAEAQVIGRQLLRSGLSVGAHCREGYRSRSTAEFISKLSGALMELEESVYWIELLFESDIIARPRLEPLHREADELTAILVASLRTAKGRRGKYEKRRAKKDVNEPKTK